MQSMKLFGFGKKKEEKTESCGCSAVDQNRSAQEISACRCSESLSVRVLGSGCASCRLLLENAEKAAADLGIESKVEYVTDMAEIAGYGVMSMPALVVNEKVVSSGKVLKESEVEEILKKAEEADSACCSCGDNCVVQDGSARILVLGSGCRKCQALEANARAALQKMGDTSSKIGHITDFSEIAAYGVMSTPALVVDGKVVSSGKVLSAEEIENILGK